jgi:hypothetical protein
LFQSLCIAQWHKSNRERQLVEEVYILRQGARPLRMLEGNSCRSWALPGSPTAIACPKVRRGRICSCPHVAFGIMSLRRLSELSASAISSSLIRPVRANARLNRASRLKKSKPTPALRPMTEAGRASVQDSNIVRMELLVSNHSSSVGHHTPLESFRSATEAHQTPSR